MNALKTWSFIGAVALLILTSHSARAELEPACVENSPERQGETGCTLVETKPLTGPLKGQLFWHIDRFERAETAQAAVGPSSIALEAHGTWWLLSVEPRVDDHHGGRHVTQVVLPALPAAANYSMLVMSANIPAGLTSHVHRHSGVEAFYVVEGAQCLATPTHAYKMEMKGTLAIPAGVAMQLVATGTGPRKALAVVVYDASKPPTTHMDTGAPKLASCK